MSSDKRPWWAPEVPEADQPCQHCGAELDDGDPDYCCREAEYDNAEDQAEYQRTAEIERGLWGN